MSSNAGPRGRLFVMAAPSGAGKTSLANALVEGEENLRFSVSHTTRPPRRGEVDGRHYHFVAPGIFEAMVARGDFLEHAVVFDHRYGTSREGVESLRAKGSDVMLEIDWQGAAQVRKALPECISIFILPPTRAELERRLRTRATDSDAVIARRLRDSTSDMRHWAEFDYVVVNDDFDEALATLRDVVRGGGESARADRPELLPVVDALLDNVDNGA